MRLDFFVTYASRVGLATAMLLFSACGGRPDDTTAVDDSPMAIAEEAYIFAYPLLESYKIRGRRVAARPGVVVALDV